MSLNIMKNQHLHFLTFSVWMYSNARSHTETTTLIILNKNNFTKTRGSEKILIRYIQEQFKLKIIQKALSDRV